MLDFYTVVPHIVYTVIPGRVLESFQSFIGELKSEEKCGFWGKRLGQWEQYNKSTNEDLFSK